MKWWRRALRWLTQQWESHNSVLNSVCISLAVIFGLIALVQWGELRKREMPPDWGNVPEWVAAFGTLAAFAALALTVAEWRSGRADQARLIIAQPARDAADPSTMFAAEDDVVIQNHSTSPVFDLEIDSLEYEPDDRFVWEDLSADNVHAPAKRPVFKPGEITGRLTVVGAIEGGREAGNPKIKYLIFSFTDANGRRWKRTGSAQPARIYGES